MSEEDISILGQLLKMVQTLSDKVEMHIVKEDHRLELLDQQVEVIAGIVQAFPHLQDGTPDFRGHRRAHDDSIESGRSWNTIWQTIKNKVAENLVTAVMVLVVLGYTTWQGQLTEQRHLDSEAKAAAQQAQTDKLIQTVTAALKGTPINAKSSPP